MVRPIQELFMWPVSTFRILLFQTEQEYTVGDLVDPKFFESAEDLAQHVRNEIVRLRNGLPNYKEDDKYSVPEASL